MYQIVYPKSINDIKKESRALRHMADKFVDGVLEGKYVIAFLRRIDAPKTPLLTIMVETSIDANGEFRVGKILQTGGLDNRKPTPEEQEFLDQWQAQNKAA